MSIQEVMHHILSIKLVSSSFQVITTSLDGSRKLKLTADGSLNTEPSLLDTYAGRGIYETDFQEFPIAIPQSLPLTTFNLKKESRRELLLL